MTAAPEYRDECERAGKAVADRARIASAGNLAHHGAILGLPVMETQIHIGAMRTMSPGADGLLTIETTGSD